MRDDDAVEGGARGADPFAALDTAKDLSFSKSLPTRLGVNTSTSPIRVVAQAVKPARSVPSASGWYQIWLSMS